MKDYKSSRYWETHKETLNSELDKLTSREISFIINYPETSHARRLYKRVDKLVSKELHSLSAP